MINSNLLKGLIVTNGKSMSEMAKALDINKTTLWRKISGKATLTHREILKLKESLNLNMDEIAKIFF